MKRTAKKIMCAAVAGVFALFMFGGAPAFAKSRTTHTHSTNSGAHASKSNKKKAGPVKDARKLFAAKKLPAAMPMSSIGTYANGCIAGAVEIPLNGRHYQVMRPSRNRHWGHQRLKDFWNDFTDQAFKDGWNGGLSGDIGQPRGGPMPTGHASHQMGLDMDIWLIPAPDHVLSDKEREEMDAPSMLKIDSEKLDPKVWKPAHEVFVKDALEQPSVARIFMTPAIKEALCDRWPGAAWLRKARPCDGETCEGHDDHIHVRLSCAPGDKNCHNQDDPPLGTGCGAELTHALNYTKAHPPYSSNPEPSTPKTPFPLSRMPAMCTRVLNSAP